jgi:hypothetical protein
MSLLQNVKQMERLAFEVERAPMPQQIRLYNAELLVSRARAAYEQFVKRANAVINESSSYGVRSLMRKHLNAVTDSYQRKIGRVQTAINQAKAQGLKEISGKYVAANTGLLLHDITGGYAAFAEIESYKPWFIKMMPELMLKLFVKLAEAVEVIIKYAGIIWDALTNTIDNIGRGTSILIDILKWGTLAGGLYLLYRTLEPKERKALTK